MAAEPVSPLVAPTMVTRLPERFRLASKSPPMSCIATSLKASVGPWKSSSSQSFGAIWTSGTRAAWPKPA